MTNRIVPPQEWGATRRGGWGARPLPATVVVVHYPGAKAPPGEDATAAEDYAYQRYLEEIGYSRFGPHTGTGWGEDELGPYGAGISYSLSFPKSGRVLRGHDPRRQSSHTKTQNYAGMGYCIWIAEGEEPTRAQLEAVAWALNEQVRLEEIAVAKVDGGHLDYYPTACPTPAIMAAIPEMNALAGGTAVARRRPTSSDIRSLAKRLAQRGFVLYCDPTDFDSGVCRPGNHSHSSDSRHFLGLAVDFGWPGAAISAMERLHVLLMMRELANDPVIDWRRLFDISDTNHPDHGHVDDNSLAWADDVRDRFNTLARDGFDLFVSPTAFPNHIPPINRGFTLSWWKSIQAKMSKVVNPKTGKPFYTGRLDGYGGTGSTAGVKAFQTFAGLEPDGNPGPLTNAALDKALAPVVDPYAGFTRTQIEAAQRLLKVAGWYTGDIDGLPGPMFQTAMRTAQTKLNLTVDLLPGPKTMAALTAYVEKLLTPTLPVNPPAPEPPPVLPPPVVETPPPSSLADRMLKHRIAGANAYDTAVAAATFVPPEGEGVLLYARDTPDAQAATLVAGRALADALPVPRGGGLPPAIRAYLENLEPDWVYAVGGPASVLDTTLYEALMASGIPTL